MFQLEQHCASVCVQKNKKNKFSAQFSPMRVAQVTRIMGS